jgi:hypothetical protein
MLVGAAIGSKVKSLGVIFVIATFLHVLFDRLPHFEYFKKSSFDRLSNREFSFLFLAALVDLLVGILIIWGLVKEALFSTPILLGIFFSILPDGFVFGHVFLRLILNRENKILRRLYLFHNDLHISNHKNSLLLGLFLESFVIILSIILIQT